MNFIILNKQEIEFIENITFDMTLIWNYRNFSQLTVLQIIVKISKGG